MHASPVGAEGKSVLDQSYDLLEYLSAVAREVGPKPVRDIAAHEFLTLPSEVPDHSRVRVGPGPERTSWLEVRRVPEPPTVAVPADLADLVDAETIRHPDARPRLHPRALTLHLDDVAASEDDEETALAIRAEELDAVEEQFDEWQESTWLPWTESVRDDFSARALYRKLYELHLRLDVDSATHELVWGHVVLSFRSAEGSVVAPLLTTAVSIDIDPDDATIRVIPELAVELELDAVEGTSLPGLEGLVALRGSVRAQPPDVWSPEERLHFQNQVAAPLGLDVTLVHSTDLATPVAAPHINDGWALYLRRRPMRQERFYDELAHKIQDEDFLPEALASVVADADRVSAQLLDLRQEAVADDGTADRLMMPLPANDEQQRIARQLARSRGVTVQGPPGTGKSHTIVNLVSHLVAQGKRVLVTAEKEQALSVLRDKIPQELRDLSIAVLGSTPAAMAEMRDAVQSMQDSLSSIDVETTEREISELGSRIDALRDSLQRTDAQLVEALRSEQREYTLPSGPSRAADVARWLSSTRHLDVISDDIAEGTALPLTTDELTELVELLGGVPATDATAAVLDLPLESWLPTQSELEQTLTGIDGLRSQVSDIEDSGLRVEAVENLDLSAIRQLAHDLREVAARERSFAGEWEDRLARGVRNRDPAASFVAQHNASVRSKLSEARAVADRLAGHEISVPEGNPAEQIPLIDVWAERLASGKKVSVFASRELKDLSAAARVDGYPATTVAHLELVRWHVNYRSLLREVRTLASQAYAPYTLPVPDAGPTFLFLADDMARRVEELVGWWFHTFPAVSSRIASLTARPFDATDPNAVEHIADLVDRSASRLEERKLTTDLEELSDRLLVCRDADGASPLWSALLSALDLARPDAWGATLDEARRLVAVRGLVLRRAALAEKLSSGGAPRWSRTIVESLGAPEVTGDLDDAPLAWERAKARTWLSAIHAEVPVARLMEQSHSEALDLRRTVVQTAAKSARVQLKRNLKDSQRRALDTWLTAVKKVGKGTGKNAPRFQNAAREALPAAMGSVPIWIMPIYRVMENFDPRISELFDVVVVDESSQCDLLSLGVLALGKKAVVVGDDKQTTPNRVGIQVDRIAALQDQHLRGMPEAKLLTLDESLYSISGRAFPSTIALKEHFRCVPEIIQFSNRYYGGAVLPLREITVPQIGAPVRAVRVDGLSVTTGAHRVNRDEVDVIAAQVAACAEDPAYDGLTFGVVTMMSGPQAQFIQDRVRALIGDEEFERRRLRVGNPPAFQGDERNVVFISMVAHDNSFAATKPVHAQWANVAASRAQDQLWVFHSMDPTTLHHEDQRRALIQYAQGASLREEASDLFALTESKFEHDVLTQMLDRGFEVVPQHRVGSYRIDFVVEVAPGERLAVECDGDSFHGPDKWNDDVRRQRVLERLGWSFWRIRASEYYLNPSAALEPLWARLASIADRAAETEIVRQKREKVAEDRRLADLRLRAQEQTDETAAPTVGEPDRRAAPATPSSLPAAPVSTSTPHEGRTSDAAAIRQWARDNGYAIGDRGRLPVDVELAYRRAKADAFRNDG